MIVIPQKQRQQQQLLIMTTIAITKERMKIRRKMIIMNLSKITKKKGESKKKKKVQSNLLLMMLVMPVIKIMHHPKQLGATQDGYHHTRTDVHRDAALSLTYALESCIYWDDNNNSPLSFEEASALNEWLDLLHWTLPPTWMVHTLISYLRCN